MRLNNYSRAIARYQEEFTDDEDLELGNLEIGRMP